MPPHGRPIGRHLAENAKVINRAFQSDLAAAGGAEHTWNILVTLMTQKLANQRELAAHIGIQGATLTHHLNGMEDEGLLTRTRDPENRRVHVVALTDAGREMFFRMRGAAVDFDRKLRGDIPEAELAQFEATLDRLRANLQR